MIELNSSANGETNELSNFVSSSNCSQSNKELTYKNDHATFRIFILNRFQNSKHEKIDLSYCLLP
jgi:hypothetical protein